jgi:hypothetical protein
VVHFKNLRSHTKPSLKGGRKRRRKKTRKKEREKRGWGWGHTLAVLVDD